jgi:hypothetical protein
MPAILAILIKVLPSLVAIAELIFNRPQAGADKKDWVMGIIGNVMQGVDAGLTGGAAETWAAIKPNVGVIVDASAAIAFPKPANPQLERDSNY